MILGLSCGLLLDHTLGDNDIVSSSSLGHVRYSDWRFEVSVLDCTRLQIREVRMSSKGG